MHGRFKTFCYICNKELEQLKTITDMKKLFTHLFLTMLMSMGGTQAFAYYDLAVENTDGVTIYYTWINDKTELSVTYIG